MQTKIVSKSAIKNIRPYVDVEQKPHLGIDWIPCRYSNVACIAQKQSGKTTVLLNILKRCTNRHTAIIIISNTANLDKLLIDTIDRLRKKGYEIEVFDSLIDENGVNIIANFLESVKRSVDDVGVSRGNGSNEPKAVDDVGVSRGNGSNEPKAVDVEDVPAIPIRSSGLSIGSLDCPVSSAIINHKENIKELLKNKEQKEHKEQKTVLNGITPRYLIYLDDLGEQLRDKYITQLLKTNRHSYTMVLLAAQNLNDLKPEALRQLQVVLIFKNFSDLKLKELYDKLDLHVDFDKFKSIYDYATKEPYSFLMIDRMNNKFRIKFQHEFIL